MRENVSVRGGGSGGRPTSFDDYLSQLKQTGSGLLVTGETPGWVRQHASRQLFGTTRPRGGERPRRRIVVRTAEDYDPQNYLPTGACVNDEQVRVVTAATSTRSATASQPTAAGPVVDGGLSTLAETVETTAADLVDQAVVEPGELRIGITSVLPFVEMAGLDATVEFCAAVASTAREYGGMAHVHCPLADSDPRLRRFDDPLDARVELRQEASNPIQCRWHTPYPELNLELGWVDFV